MSNNGIIKFKLNRVDYALFFGMKAVRIFQELMLKETLKANGGTMPSKKEDLKQVDEMIAFAITIYAGMCNEAESDQLEYPSYKEAYSLANDILLEPGLDAKIWNCFKESRASENLMSLMGLKKKTIQKKQQTGIR